MDLKENLRRIEQFAENANIAVVELIIMSSLCRTTIAAQLAVCLRDFPELLKTLCQLLFD